MSTLSGTYKGPPPEKPTSRRSWTEPARDTASAAANVLTQWSSYYIDWNNVGRTFRSGREYSTRQILDRTAIAASTLAGVAIGTYYKEFLESLGVPEEYSNEAAATTGGIAGFLASHAAVMYPRIQNRWKMQEACQQSEANIVSALDGLETGTSAEIVLKSSTAIAVDQIKNSTVLAHGKVNATATWVNRKRMFQKLESIIADKDLSATDKHKQVAELKRSTALTGASRARGAAEIGK